MRKAHNTGSSLILGRQSKIGKKKKKHEAKTKSTFKPVDKLNNTESQKEAMKPNKEEENSTSVWEGHEDKGTITKPICDPDKDCEKPGRGY